jgi:hypothetical protein
VTVTPEAGRKTFAGLTRHGVTSANSRASEGSFRFAAAPAASECPNDFQAFIDAAEPLACTCSAEAAQRGYVWGMDVYAADSQVCRAAVHTGVISKAGGPVTVIPEAGRKTYAGLTRHDVTSANRSGSEGSFRFATIASDVSSK